MGPPLASSAEALSGDARRTPTNAHERVAMKFAADEPKVCGACGSSNATKICGNCKEQPYCSLECARSSPRRAGADPARPRF